MTGEARDDDLQRWVDEFDARQLVFENLRTEIENELRTAITVVDPEEDAAVQTELFKVHDLRSRVKKAKSFREKIGRKRYTDPFNEMRDVVGARVVCLFLSDLPTIDGIIREKFDVKDWQDKTQEAGPDKFGYRAVHYDCQIKPGYSGPHYDRIKDIWFEVQVRTILQDAWAVVEHILAYKGLRSIPSESRADFNALVGLFHLADKTFQQLRDAATQQDADAEAAVAMATGGPDLTVSRMPSVTAPDAPLNRSTVKALLRQLYPEREACDDSDYSELVEDFASAGVTGIRELQVLLSVGRDAALRREAESPPEDEDGNSGTYWDVGFARQSMKEALPEYSLPVRGWGDEDTGEDGEG